MNRAATFLASATALAATTLAAPSAAIAMEGVVASIKPIHSLVAGVMEGVGEPELLVEGAGSPHTYSMRPSDAAKLENARLVFWVGQGMETFLERPLASLAADATVVALEDTPDLVKLEYREGGAFEAHSHGDSVEADHATDDHADDHHADHAHDHDDSHAHGHDHAHGDEDGHAHDAGHAHDHGHDHAHGHDHGHDHAHGDYDLHLWLDPENARSMVREIEAALAAADPDNAARYAQNADALNVRLDELVAEVTETVSDVSDRPFVVFHDAYHYFENRFGLQAAGTITVSPEIAPGAQRVGEIQARVGELGATCVFAEPQFEPRIVEVVTEGTDARSGVLDPLGADLSDGPDLYFQLIQGLAASLTGCLADES
jgi:zinc transport system substrate-binding protein